MKATGIVRRVDNLGRVVIPKEIRRTMRVEEGDPLEIFVCEDGSIKFKKYEVDPDYKQMWLDLKSLVNLPENLTSVMDEYEKSDLYRNY